MAYRGQTAVITGGTGGIGYAIARQLLSAGAANIALLDICDNDEKLKALQKDYKTQNIILLKTDITKRETIDKTFKDIISKFNHIDIVVNSAGILKETDVEATINTNLIGLIYTTLVAFDYMSKTKDGNGGVIVNISSVMGLSTIPSIPTYIASKHAVLGFTRALSHEHYLNKHGIKLLVICPGLTDTSIIQGFADKILFKDTFDLTNNILSALPIQTADAAAKCLTDLIPTAKNGSVWIIDEGKAEQITIPKYWRI